MTNEEKQLLLKDLCARLPYGVIVYFDGWNPEELTDIDLHTMVVNGMGGLPKPYLRPLSSMTERIEEEIRNNEKPYYDNPEYEWEELANKDFYEEGGKRYSDETIAEFRNGIEALKKAYVYAQRIDWLLSGDDGEESFHERLKEDLEELKLGKI